MTPDIAHEVDSAELRDRVTECLTRTDPRISSVSVEVFDGTVQLRGKVPSYYLRSLAIEAAGRVADGRTIDDQLRVGPAW